MLGNFSYYNPTKLYFGDESLNFLKDELKGYGPVVLLNYGSGVVYPAGYLDLTKEDITEILKESL
jgi:alcohol dehydrogenase YqhD (iron-dependent ADH family)